MDGKAWYMAQLIFLNYVMGVRCTWVHVIVDYVVTDFIHWGYSFLIPSTGLF